MSGPSGEHGERGERRVPTARAMRDLGVRLAGLLRAGDLVVLSGGLGSGKTTLTQGIGEGLKVRGPITSPTFVIARVHPSLSGGPALVHVDAYRLGGLAEVDDLDLDASLDEAVTVVEWGAGLVEGLAADRLVVELTGSAEHGAPEDGAPEHGAPEHGAPEDGAPEHGAPEHGAPEHGAPEHGAPEHMAPEGAMLGEAADEERIVRFTGIGDRWAGGFCL